MADRKLLILTYHFPPSSAAGAYRILGFVDHLREFGWQSVVVAPPGLPWEPTDPALLERVPPEAAVYRVSYPDHWLWKPVRKFFPWGAWLPLALRRCRRAVRDHRPDIVLTSGPPHGVHLLGRHIHRWSGIPWVADFRDPWVAGDPYRKKLRAEGWEARAEASVMREADGIIANTPGARSLLQEAYPRIAAKITSITNGYDPEVFKPNPIPPLSGSTIEIIHTGTIYANRTPTPFLEALEHLDTSVLKGKTLRVRFIGDVIQEAQRHEIEKKIRSLSSASVTVEGHGPYRQSIQAMVEADLLLLLDSPGRRTGVPAKLFEYIGAGRPVLALAEAESDVAWVLRESGTPYRIAPPLDAQAVRFALSEILEDPATTRGGRQNKTTQTRFIRRYLAGELAAMLNTLPTPPLINACGRPLSKAVQ